jgi:hypothetical protein
MMAGAIGLLVLGAKSIQTLMTKEGESLNRAELPMQAFAGDPAYASFSVQHTRSLP